MDGGEVKGSSVVCSLWGLFSSGLIFMFYSVDCLTILYGTIYTVSIWTDRPEQTVET